MKRAVFLDKDGTLIENVPYNADPAKIRLVPGAGTALQQLEKEGYLLIVISNQSGVALGYFPESALQDVRRKIELLLLEQHARIHDFYYCPHLPEGKLAAYRQTCTCRKPAPGLLLRAAHEYDIDLKTSWMIGDILDDVEAGNRAGCTTILLNNGNETSWQRGAGRTPHFIVNNLNEAAGIILTTT